ncbi:MAG: D-aminoacyl-tRNA deacylase, partial [Myxococcota bacterium]
EIDWMARKCAGLRIFPDDAGKMNRSVRDVTGEVLVVSQFTLYGNALKGQRPSFIEAEAPERAERLYQEFAGRVGEEVGRPTQTGRFGADMKVHLINDGPVTLWLDRPPKVTGSPEVV